MNRSCHRALLAVWAGGLGVGLATGCARVPVHQQRLVSKPNMQFSESAVFNYYSSLLPQVEAGTATSGGAQAAGCTTCR